MTKLKSQKQLLKDKSPLIIFSGSYASGKTTALMFKSLSTRSSIVLDLDYRMINNNMLANDYLKITKYDFNRTTYTLNTKDSTVHFFSYEKANERNIMLGTKTEFVLFDNFESVKEDLAKKIFRQVQARAKQIIMFINPVDLRKHSFIRKLDATIINASLKDNPNIPNDYIKTLTEEYRVPKCFIEGKFDE